MCPRAISSLQVHKRQYGNEPRAGVAGILLDAIFAAKGKPGLIPARPPKARLGEARTTPALEIVSGKASQPLEFDIAVNQAFIAAQFRDRDREGHMIEELAKSISPALPPGAGGRRGSPEWYRLGWSSNFHGLATGSPYHGNRRIHQNIWPKEDATICMILAA